MTRVLVAGSGYIGTSLALSLRASGHEVYALRRRPTALDGFELEVITADITKPLPALPDVEVAFFTAAPDTRDERSYRSIYVDGLRNLAEALEVSSRLFFTSSTAVYGQDDGREVDETSETRPADFRGRVLLEAEELATVSLRLGGIYGPGRARALVRLRSGEARSQPGRFLNLIHRDDVCGALEHLMSLPNPRSVYIGVDEEPVESDQLYRWLAEQEGRPPVPEDPPDSGAGSRGKRCSSERLGSSGYGFRYPTYRDGYGELMRRRVLDPCPDSPNCVSSRATDARHRMSARRFAGSASQVAAAIERALNELGGRVVVSEIDYLRAEFSSRVFRFVDDVEIAVDSASKTIDFRSASRVGYSDLGVNRRRLHELWRMLVADGKILR